MTDAPLGFWRIATEQPDRPALYADADGQTYTYGELHARANRMANGLRALGLTTGDTVAVALPNTVQYFEVVLGCLQVGIYCTPINWHLVGPEIAYIVNDSDARVFITDARFAPEATAARAEITLEDDRLFAVGDIEGYRRYDELTDGQSADPPADRTAGMTMHYTSGTTGRPKGVKRGLVEIDPDDMFALYTGFQSMFGIEAHGDGVHICGSPLYHTAVLMWSGSALHMGHKVVLMDKWDPVRMMELIAEHQVTWSHMVPTQFHRILQAVPPEDRERYDVSSLRAMVHAAAPCPPDIKRQMIEWWGDAIWEYYGATEGGGTIITAAQWLEKPGSVGLPWPGFDVKILDEDGNEVPADTEGTVYMTLGAADFEYKGDEAKTKDNRTTDGFFTVGDWGLIDEDGYLFLKDRKSDMIISGGVNIYPAEIEAVLYNAPGVDDVAVFGIPHDDWGEEVKAVIQLTEDAPDPDTAREQIAAFCETQLAKFKRPRTIDFIDEMPRDPNGKLYKRKLRDPFWEGRDRQI